MNHHYQAERQARLRAEGTCVSCGREQAIGRWFCPACKARHREQCRQASTRRRARLMAAGMCRDCGQPRGNLPSRCAACVVRCNSYSAKSRARKKENAA
jgi:hypothetical protein